MASARINASASTDHMGAGATASTGAVPWNEREDKANALSFSKLCLTFEAIEKSAAGKDEKLRRLFSVEFRKHLQGQSPFPVLRLVLPHLDIERQQYGLKQASVAKAYVNLLSLSNSSKDAQALLHWKDPTKQVSKNVMVGDLSTVLEEILRARVGSRESGASIGEANRILDELAAAPSQEKHTVLRRILSRFSACEQKWLMRMVFRDMKIGLKHESVLGFIHEDANDRYNACCNLRQVSAEFASAQHTSGSIASTISVLQPFAPMRAKGLKTQLQQIEPAMQGHPFVMDIKLDGERMICHKKGDQIMWVTRNSNDYSDKYGPAINSYILDNVNVHTCILDGEMCAWSEVQKRFVAFGSNRTVAQEEAENSSTAHSRTRWLMYVVFDMVYIDGPGSEEVCRSAGVAKGSIMHLPLQTRREILNSCISQVPHRLELVHSQTVMSLDAGVRKKAILDYFDAAVNRGEEGLVIKDLNSEYTLGERSRARMAWVKMKPEYSDMTSNLDLIVLGGYYGEGSRRSGGISHFLLGAKDPHPADELPQKFYTVTKVGSGYSIEELDALRDKLNAHLVEWPKNGSCPPHFSAWRYKSTDRPDVYIPPEKSVVFEIKCAEMVTSDQFAATVTCRFPRCVCIRYDKPWYECDDMSAVRAAVNAPRTRVETSEGTAGARKKRKKNKPIVQMRQKMQGKIADTFKVVKQGDVVVEGHVFDGIEFCVCSSNTYNKRDVEQLITRHGGMCVISPRSTIRRGGKISVADDDVVNTIIIAEQHTIAVLNYMDQGDYDVMKVQFIHDSVKNGALAPLSVHYFLKMRNETAQEMRKTMDEFGDAYCGHTDVETLKRVFETVARKHNIQHSSDRDVKRSRKQEDTQPFEANLFSSREGWRTTLRLLHGDEQDELDGPWSIFRTCVVYLDVFSDLGSTTASTDHRVGCRIAYHYLLPLESCIAARGGLLACSLHAGVTHVIVSPQDTSRIPIIRQRLRELREDPTARFEKRVLLPQWVETCVQVGRLVEPTATDHALLHSFKLMSV